jgi:hypothetical protein
MTPKNKIACAIKTSRTLGAKSEAKVGGISSCGSLPAATNFSPLREFTMIFSAQEGASAITRSSVDRIWQSGSDRPGHQAQTLSGEVLDPGDGLGMSETAESQQ